MAPGTHDGERRAFEEHLRRHGLNRSAPREAVFEAFVRAGRHLSVEELLALVRKRRPDVGHTTVYRTLKLLEAAGLASQIAVDGQARFERVWQRAHHDHLVCRRCGLIREFESPQIEQLQAQIAASFGFEVEGHLHQITGLCARCRPKIVAPAVRR